ncbi:MAG: class I SAM-dependent methyltransferase [Chloroflexi bacterium]|jgi:2-polyprenyl-3-methyl-5-hydroxy-6-metoxy-1,4-benzoquinol methylase|nr:class I SAM-dependent methyltransferase [Chloroflexota bacterium]
MSAKDRVRWDAIYRETANFPYPYPDPLLFQYVPPIHGIGRTFRALDLACGLGQNGLWLAAQDYVVDLMDISRMALTRAQDQAVERGLRNVNFIQVDIDELKLDANTYDVVCVVRFLRRELFPMLRGAIKPGGRIIYESFNTRCANLVSDAPRDFLLGQGELAGYFGDWRVLRNSEVEHVSQVVAIKPE